MNDEALKYAWKAHEKQMRKGTKIPYIIHPIEVALILIENGAKEDLVTSGLLHDTLEDTGATLEEIREKFGDKVAELVKGASEPSKISAAVKLTEDQEKSSWKERKERTIKCLAEESIDVKLVSCADKLSNIKSMLRDFKEIGNDLWDRFNAGYEDQKWYYEGLVKSLESLSEYKLYQEFKSTVEELFYSLQIIKASQ